MKKLLLLGIALLTMGGMAHAQLEYEIDQEFKSFAELEGKAFMIANKADGKAIYNRDAQNLAYDTYSAAMTGTGPYFKLEAGPEVGGSATYKFLVVNASGNNVGLWGNSSIYLNSGKPGGFNGCFVLGNGGQNGTDLENGGIWYVEYVEGNGWTLKNVAREGYFAGVNPAPTGEDPIYWDFITVQEKVALDDTDPGVKTLTDEQIADGWVDMIENGNCNRKTKNANFWMNGETEPVKCTIKSGNGRMGGNGIMITSVENASADWDSQFFIKANEPLPSGTKIHVEFDYKASKAAKVTTQIHAAPGKYTSNASIGDVNCGRSWQHFETDLTIGDAKDADGNPVQSIAFNLSVDRAGGIDYYFDNMVLWARPCPIAQPAYAGEGAQLVDLAAFQAVGAGQHYDGSSYSDRTGEATWDAETKTFTGWCGFQWDGEGFDGSEYRYLVITPAKNMSLNGYEVNIKDKNGKVVGGDDYGVGYRNLWFGEWNNHSCLSIDMEKLRINKEFDVYHITDLVIDGGDGFTLGTVYVTNQEPKNSKNWNGDNDADIVIANLPEGKYGTICLPYRAVAAAATVYEIIGKDETGITLGEVEGFMEAGKPYIYKNNGSNRDEEANKIFFYKASKEAEVEAPVENNGLIGTFTAMTSESIASANNFVLSGNKIYNLEGATGENKVNIGANRAYINMSKVQNLGGGDIKIYFDAEEGTTDINEIVNVLNDGKFYDLLGREVTNPVKGNIYIVKGKKVIFQ
jgi:hypothetical protein